MNYKNQIGKILIFMHLVCSMLIIQAQYLTYGRGFDESVHVKLSKIENETEGQDFQLFNGFDAPSALVCAQTIFNFDTSKEIGLSSNNLLAIKCCKGSYVPVFIQDGGFAASGVADEGFDGPFFISMWLSIPNIVESDKVRVRYQVKKDSIGKIGLRIGKLGDYRLVAYENVKFIEN